MLPVVIGNHSERSTTQARATGSESRTFQPKGALESHASSNSLNPGIDLAAIVLIGPAVTRFTRIFWGPSERARYRDADSSAFCYTHPVIRRPSEAGIKIQAYNGSSILHKRGGGFSYSLEGIGRNVKARCDIIPARRKKSSPRPTSGMNPIACRAPSTCVHFSLVDRGLLKHESGP